MAACSGSRQAKLPPGELRVQLAGEPFSVDPSLAEDGLSLKILANTAEGLVGYNGANQLVARAARDWSVSRDGLTYRFRLAAERRWSDGVALEARHFKMGLDRSRDPGTGARLAELLSSIESVSAPSAQELVIRLKRKTPYFLQVLSLPVAAPQRGDGLASGSGRYWIKERKRDQSWLLEANPHYGVPLPEGAPRQIRLVITADESTALALFEQSRVDVLTKVPQFDAPALKARGLLHVDPFWATYYLGFNARDPELRDPRVRCELGRAVDKDGIIRVLQAGLEAGETRADSWIPPGIEGHSTQASSPTASVSLPPRLVALLDSSVRNQQVMEKIQADFKKKGVALSLSNMDWKSFLKELRTHPPQVFRMGWLAPFADPISHLQALTSKNPNNLTGWSNPAYDRLVAQIDQMEPGTSRLKKIREAQRILLEQECPVVPIYHYVQAHAVLPRVSGFAVNGMGVIRWDELRLSR